MTMDVSAYFTIPEGVTPTYSVNDPSPGIARVSISGHTVTIQPITEGDTGKVIVTASATGCTGVTRDYNVSVGPPQDPPPPSCPSANTVPVTVPAMFAGGDSVTMDVSAYFTIPEGVTPTYSVNDPSPGIARVSISGHTVTIQPITEGDTGKVIVTASATGCTGVTRDYNVSVGPPQDPPPPSCPSANTVPVTVPAMFAGGDSVTMDVSAYFTIPEGVTPTYSVNDPSPGIARVSISGHTVTIQPITEGDTGKVIVTASATGCTGVTRDYNVSVGPPQDPPPPSCPSANTVPVTVPAMFAGGDSVTMDVSAYFTIPEGVTPTYSVNDPSPGIARVSISGHTVTIQPITEGDTGKVIVTASATGCTGVTRDYNVSVGPPQDPPPPSCPSANTVPVTVPAMFAGGDSVTMDVSAHFTIPEGVTPIFSVNDPSPGTATVSISGDTLTIQPITEGDTGKVIVTASATGCTGVTRDFNVTVGPPQDPPPPSCPSANTVPVTVPAMCAGGDSVTMDVSAHFTIPEGVTPIFSVNDPSPGTATVSISGDTLTIQPITEGDTGKVIVTASATGCTGVTRDFNVTVDPVPPTAECPAVKQMHPSRILSLVVDGIDVDVDLNSHFTNLSRSNVNYTIVSSDTGVATASRTGATLAISPGIAGTAQVTVTVSRCGCGTGASQVFNVSVEPPAVPCPGTNGTIPAQELTVGGDAARIDISGYFTLPSGFTPEYEASSSDNSIATASMTGDTLTVRPLAAGTETVTVSIDNVDAACSEVAQSFVVTVSETVVPPPPPPPPVPCPVTNGTIPAQELTIGEDAVKIVVSGYFMLPSGFMPEYEASSSDAMIATASMTGDTLTVSPVAAGTDTVTVSIDNVDAACSEVAQSFVVTVSETVVPPPPPPPPVPCPVTNGTIPAQELTIGEDAVKIVVSGYFMLPSGFMPEYEASSSDAMIATASMTGDTLTVSPVAAGTDTVTVSIDNVDAACSEVAQSLMVTVSETVVPPPPPPPPVPCPVTNGTIPAQELTIGEDAVKIVVSGYFMLPSGFMPEYEASSSDAMIATASMTGDTLTVSPVAAGTDTVTVSIDNVDAACSEVAQSLMVTVSETVVPPPPPPPPVPCPVTNGTIPAHELTVGEDAVKIVVSGYFMLPSGFMPEYEASSSDAMIATASMTGDTLTVSPVAAGTDAITVTVSISNAAEECGVVAQSILVTVSPSCPAAVMDASIPDQMLFTIGDAATIDLMEFFEHIDQEGVQVTVTSPDPAIAEVSNDGTTITIDPVSEGTIDAVEITISKTGCDPLTDSFMLTVKDPFSVIWSVSAEGAVYRLEGNVGIGLSNPDQKLVVDGKIKAEEVYLSMIPADYVFEEDYSLMPLEDVAEHIEARGHLPGIAPGAEMKSRGIGISRMQTLLLEKIEELSLYIITQHEQLVSQGDHVASQQRRLALRAQRISQLEIRLERLER